MQFMIIFLACYLYWITLLSALFMTSVISVYLFIAPEGFNLPKELSYPIGLGITLGTIILFVFYYRRVNK